MRLYSGWPDVEASTSPCRCNVTVLLKASLRVTVKFGPSVGVAVVLGMAT